ncbi:WD40 repeat-like protein [Irpex rosettiformis]|uniref:WD40 repeat-like protein n=1 Tax=Irpex rosettiformis TaxID=378272 RepID=A0ACB8TVP6_9APHY|nr:WD40 repeat-like protein [Irpex rosettiformis]
MRLPENDSESALSVTLADVSEAGPSTTSNLSNGYNGVVKENGYSAYTNGNGKMGGVDGLKAEKQKMSVSRVSLPGTTLYDDSYVDREEFIRLVIQSLRDVGYIESAATLEAESGYTMETSDVSRFRECILNGDWTAAGEVLSRLGFSEQEGLWDAKFLISQQKYLELLEAGRTTTALQVLREELAPLSTDPDVLHSLSSLLMCRDTDDLRQASGWDGVEGTSRRKLLVNLQRYIPSSVMIPQRRFASLLDHARDYQRTRCLYHNIPLDAHNFTLYADHVCDKDHFPRITTAILEVHTDEVWNLQWSHSGSYLATASKDKSAVVWRIDLDAHPQTREYRPVHILRDHPYPVGYVAWSLDDSVLLTSSENYIKMWNTRTGSCIRTLDSHHDVVSALVWLPDGSGFISGGLDRKIILWDADGKQRDSWGRTPIRVTDLAITPDFTKLVAVGMYDVPTPPPPTPTATGDGANAGSAAPAIASPPKEFRLAVWDLSTKQLETFERMEGELTSVKISDDSRYALINRAPEKLAGEIHLWEISTGLTVRKYTGHQHQKHVLRSCFGGVDENFVASGSEDGNVYIWHRETAMLLEKLEGHGSGSVNSVVWNPRNERMFATCSDDHTVRIWEAPIALSITNADVGEFAHDYDGAGKGKGKDRETWSLDGHPGATSYGGLVGTSRSL